MKLNESSERAFSALIESQTSSALAKELFRRQIEAKRKALDYESETATVQMLINQAIICHLRLTTFEAWYAKKMQESMTLTLGAYYDKLLSSHQNRFFRACVSLARVKKLLNEAELKDQEARCKRGQATLNSQRLYRMLSESQ